MLNGGLPAWEAAGFSVDAAAISQDDASAPAKAAHSTAMAPSYTAQLQVCLSEGLRSHILHLEALLSTPSILPAVAMVMPSCNNCFL